PKNQRLVDSISEISKAVLDALWTDEVSLPRAGEPISWEVWLRTGADRETLLETFAQYAQKLGLDLEDGHLSFPDRTVVIARGTRGQISRSADLLNCVAELRKAKDTADFFTAMTAPEQVDWIDDALGRITFPPGDSPAVCILDTGVNNAHPLLRDSLADNDMHTYDPAWNSADHDGHGTEMAGLALFGDLTDLLVSKDAIQVGHILESVKILPPPPGENPRKLYGKITAESMARAEVQAPQRKRV